MKTLLIAISILISLTATAKADNAAAMSKPELASYIAGRLNESLKAGDYQTAEYCDENGCAVVVQ